MNRPAGPARVASPNRAMPSFVRAATGALATLLLAACGAEEAPEAEAPPPPAVVVAPVASEDVTPMQDFIGRVVPVDQVDLRARVQGFLEERLFKEGERVAAGDLLFRIEQAPYEAAVAQRRAELASARAAAANAEAQLARARELVQNQNIPESEVDEREAAFEMAQAQVLQADAALQEAQLQLDYTEIRAPIAGRIGLSEYTLGSLVGPDSGPLASIVRQDPVYVTFPVSQQLLTERRRAAGGAEDADQFVVRLELADGSLYEQPGTINFADVAVDPGTDTVTVRAEFPNPDRLLTPGQFVDVVVETEDPTTALVIPQGSVQVDQAGPYVLVVGENGTVEARRVALGRQQGTDIVVESGVQEGEAIIVEGIQKARPGQQVQPTAAPVGPAGPGGPGQPQAEQAQGTAPAAAE